jgi:hypothetical protein
MRVVLCHYDDAPEGGLGHVVQGDTDIDVVFNYGS